MRKRAIHILLCVMQSLNRCKCRAMEIDLEEQAMSKIMVTIFKRRRFIGIICLVALIFISFNSAEYSSEAAGTAEIQTLDDLYEVISLQVMEHKSDASYSISDSALKELSSDTRVEYYDHFDEDNPLMSGCYLRYYFGLNQMFYSNGKLRVVMFFPYTKEEMDSHFKLMDELAVSLKCDSDYDTIQAVHDYLVKNFKYDHSTFYENHTDIEGFRDGQMVCSGYSLAAFYLLNKAGISTRVITGYGGDGSGDVNHMWNMVELDGRWYNMDITWDDSDEGNISYRFFLKSDKDFPGHIRMGNYATRYYDIIISDESYKLPFKLRMGMSKGKWSVLILIIVAEIAALYVKQKKKGKKEDTVYEEEQDYY